MHRRRDAEWTFVEHEIDRFLDLWKHADGRVSASWTTIVAVVAAIGAVLGVFVTRDVPVEVRVVGLAIAFAAIGATSFILVLRIVAAECTKAEYLLAVNLLRGRLADRSPGLRASLFIPPVSAPQESDLADWFETQWRARFPAPARIYAMLGVGVSLGVTAGASAWLAWGRTRAAEWVPLAVGLVVCVLAAVLVGIVLGRYRDERARGAIRRFTGWMQAEHPARPGRGSGPRARRRAGVPRTRA